MCLQSRILDTLYFPRKSPSRITIQTRVCVCVYTYIYTHKHIPWFSLPPFSRFSSHRYLVIALFIIIFFCHFLERRHEITWDLCRRSFRDRNIFLAWWNLSLLEFRESWKVNGRHAREMNTGSFITWNLFAPSLLLLW